MMGQITGKIGFMPFLMLLVLSEHKQLQDRSFFADSVFRKNNFYVTLHLHLANILYKEYREMQIHA